MRIWLICPVVALMLAATSSDCFSQHKSKKNKPDPRNSWSLGLTYGERGFGPYVSVFANLSKTTDLNFNLSFSGVSDDREVTTYDPFGNPIIPGKINRVYMMPLGIGIRKEMFRDDIEGNFIPIFNAGIAPTLVFTDPYDKNFFSAIGYARTHFAFGGYIGAGVSFSQSEKISMNFSFNYAYIPLVGNGINSVEYNTIHNVGGFQLSFGVNFLK